MEFFGLPSLNRGSQKNKKTVFPRNSYSENSLFIFSEQNPIFWGYKMK